MKKKRKTTKSQQKKNKKLIQKRMTLFVNIIALLPIIPVYRLVVFYGIEAGICTALVCWLLYYVLIRQPVLSGSIEGSRGPAASKLLKGKSYQDSLITYKFDSTSLNYWVHIIIGTVLYFGLILLGTFLPLY